MTVVQCQMSTFWVISWWEQLEDDDVCIILDQQVLLDFYSAS